jgi:hypothetical protein
VGAKTCRQAAVALTGDRITELWMVDAKPAGSDEFWA